MYTFPPVTPRIAYLRKRYREDLTSFDRVRVRILTYYYRDSENEGPIIRRARAIYRILAEVPVRIEPEELLVGNSGKYYKGSMLFPEYGGIEWIPGELECGKFDARTLAEGRSYMAQEDRDYICSVVPYWKEHCIGAQTQCQMPEGFEAVCASGVLPYNPEFRNSTTGHFNANYRKVVDTGFAAIKRDAEERLARLEAEMPADYAEKWYFYQAVMICCDGAMLFAKRYAQLAREEAERAREPRRAELQEIAERMDRIIAEPGRAALPHHPGL